MIGLVVLMMGCAAPPPPTHEAAMEARINALETEVRVLRDEVHRMKAETVVQAQMPTITTAPTTTTRRPLTVADYPPDTAPELMAPKPRSRREAIQNLHGLRTAEKAYHAEWDMFTSAPWFPTSLRGADAQEFTEDTAPEAWSYLGWTPEGDVLCQYEASADNSNGAAQDAFVVRARCDVDEDGESAVFEANRRRGPQQVTEDSLY